MMSIKEEFCLFFQEVESQLKVLLRIRGVDMRVPKVTRASINLPKPQESFLGHSLKSKFVII